MVGAVISALVAVGCSATAAGPSQVAVRSTGPAQTAQDAVGGYRSVRGFQGAGVPVRLIVRRVHINSGLERLGRAADGTVSVPKAWASAGWYAAGPRPGDAGSAVLLGHVDSTTGPAVFYRLRELRRGDRVEVLDDRGGRRAFLVTRTSIVPKARFPTADVFYPTLRPELRLITCGGAFNRRSGHYLANVIVYATAITRPATSRP